MASQQRPQVFVPADGRLRLDQLSALAAEFDGIEPGATYPAAEFARWIRGEADYRRSMAEERRPVERAAQTAESSL